MIMLAFYHIREENALKVFLILLERFSNTPKVYQI